MEVRGAELGMVVSIRRYAIGAVFALGIGLATPATALSSPTAETDPVTPVLASEVASDAEADGLTDQAAMVLLGTALIGLAAAVKRAP